MEALRLFTPDSDKVIRIQARRHQLVNPFRELNGIGYSAYHPW
jgi:hypothetical protein